MDAPVFVREVLPGRSRTEIALVLYEMLSRAQGGPVASSGPPEVGVKSAVNTPTFCPWRAQNPVQKGWNSKVRVEILKNTPTCVFRATPNLRTYRLAWPMMAPPPKKKKPAQASPHMGDPQPPRLQQRGEQPHALFHAGLVEEREVEPHRVAVAAVGIEERPRHVGDPRVQGLVV